MYAKWMIQCARAVPRGERRPIRAAHISIAQDSQGQIFFASSLRDTLPRNMLCLNRSSMYYSSFLILFPSAGSVHARSPIPTGRHVEDDGQCHCLLRTASAIHLHLQVIRKQLTLVITMEIVISPLLIPLTEHSRNSQISHHNLPRLYLASRFLT